MSLLKSISLLGLAATTLAYPLSPRNENKVEQDRIAEEEEEEEDAVKDGIRESDKIDSETDEEMEDRPFPKNDEEDEEHDGNYSMSAQVSGQDKADWAFKVACRYHGCHK